MSISQITEERKGAAVMARQELSKELNMFIKETDRQGGVVKVESKESEEGGVFKSKIPKLTTVISKVSSASSKVVSHSKCQKSVSPPKSHTPIKGIIKNHMTHH
jgi:hypothetical protein